MKQYLIIVDIGKDTSIPIKVNADSNIQAISKVSYYCLQNGYFGIGMKCIELLNNLGIIDLREVENEII